jgi:hypothetical protein
METLTVHELRELGKRLKLTGLYKLTKKQLQEKIEFAYKTQTRLVVTRAEEQSASGLGCTSSAVIPRCLKRAKAVAIHDVKQIVVNGCTLLVHCDTGLCIDGNMRVIAKATKAAKATLHTLNTLTPKDIEDAKELGLYALFPENLDTVNTNANTNAANTNAAAQIEIERLLRLVDADADADADADTDADADADTDADENILVY